MPRWIAASPSVRAFQAEWHIWLLVGQAASMALIARFTGLPSGLRGWGSFALPNILLMAVSGLYGARLFDVMLMRLLGAGPLVLLVACWGLAAFGVAFVILWLARRVRTGHPKSFWLAKWWFSSVLLLAMAEPLAYLWLQEQDKLTLPELPERESKDEFHVVALGGSTMAGWPYAPKFGLPIVYQWRLDQLYPDWIGSGKKIVVHNAAIPGDNLRQAIGRLGELEFRPDHVLLYSGHNEFYHDLDELVTSSGNSFARLEAWFAWSPAFRVFSEAAAESSAYRELKQGGNMRLAAWHIANPVMYRKRLARFRSQLEQFADYCRRLDISSQWFIPASSESVFEPNRSLMAPGASEADALELEQQYHQALSLEAGGQWSQAADIYRDGLGRHPDFSEFHFRLGECLIHSEQYDLARQHFARARDADGHPVSANADYRQAVADVATERGISLIDSLDAFREHTPHRILDRTMFHDNVHPTLFAFYLLGAEAAEQVGFVPEFQTRLGLPAQVKREPLSAAVRDAGMTAADLALAYERTADDLKWMGRLRFDESRRLREGEQYDHRAALLKSGDIKPGEQGTEALY